MTILPALTIILVALLSYFVAVFFLKELLSTIAGFTTLRLKYGVSSLPATPLRSCRLTLNNVRFNREIQIAAHWRGLLLVLCNGPVPSRKALIPWDQIAIEARGKTYSMKIANRKFTISLERALLQNDLRYILNPLGLAGSLHRNLVMLKSVHATCR